MPHARGQKKIDTVHWTPFIGASLALGAGSAGQTLLAAQHLPETLMRTRGNLLCYADATQVPGALTDVAIGFILVPEGTGSTVLWSPITDGDAPWFYYDRFAIGYEEGVTDVIALQGVPVYRATIDSKAMRKVRNREIQMVVEQVTTGTALSINVTAQGRVLSGT